MTGTVMITTGGTGGHVFPGLAVAAQLVARGARVFWLGTRDGMEATLVPRHGVEFEGVSFARRPRQGLEEGAARPVRAARRLPGRASRIIRRRAPDVVLGFGGFASFPGALMGVATRPAAGDPRLQRRRRPRQSRARLRRRPHPARLPRRAVAAGTRARSSGPATRCATRSAPSPPPEARFAGRDGPLRLLVVGGSLGAVALNERVPAALALLPAGDAAAGRPPGGREAHRRAARGLRGRRRGGRVRAVHRRHGGAVRDGRRRRLPRRRDHRVPSWPRSASAPDHRAAARGDRRRAERERALPGRRRRGGDDPAARAHRRAARRHAARAHRASVCSRWRSRGAQARPCRRRDRVADVCVALAGAR